MRLFDHLKVCLIAWGVPLLITAVAHLVPPHAWQSKEDFPTVAFTPSSIEVEQKKGGRGADYFELWLKNPNGDAYYFRDPDLSPVASLDQQIPRQTKLQIRFAETVDGKALVEINVPTQGTTILSLEKVMSEQASRRRSVHMIATIWLGLGTALWVVVARINRVESPGHPATDN